MSDFQVDLANCDREPIHIPGHIQSHGFMLVTDQTRCIRFFSNNIFNFFDEIENDLLGKPLSYIETFLSPPQLPGLFDQLLLLGKVNGYEQINPYQIFIKGEKYFLIISESHAFTLLEFEPATSTIDTDVQKMIGKSVAEMLADKNLHNLLNNTANQVKNIIQFDRVMIYRFAEDGHGEVVAESTNPGLESWLGLHYPASDIPKQARELYKLNLTRLIADVNTVPSRILAQPDQIVPLDLTWSQLRAVSPIHIQYLKNMGVASSFSISLIYKKELWGLVACHSYTPRFINFKSRESAKLIGQILSSALEFRQDEENQLLHDKFKDIVDQLSKYLQHDESLNFALTEEPVNILDFTHATGAAVLYEKKMTLLGVTPDQDQVTRLIQWFKDHMVDSIYSTTQLTAIYPEAEDYRAVASGMMICVLSRELDEYLVWFKPEHKQLVKWAGNPNKPVEQSVQGVLQISPRHSFEVWSQNVEGLSDRWHSEEIHAVIRLKEEINYAINLKAGALRLLNEKLRVAYDELDSFSYTISHDLKNPLAAVKSYAQLLERSKNLDDRQTQMLKRIVDRSNQMTYMIGAVLDYSRIGREALQMRKVNMTTLIGDVVKDLDLIYDTGKLHITVGETPAIQGDPLMVLQVFSNLIGNAVKYSQEADPSTVHIEGNVEGNEVIYRVRDNGLGIAEKDLPHIFELFNRMDNVTHIEGSGVGLAIVKRMIDKHKGRIWAESQLNAGSLFSVSFNH